MSCRTSAFFISSAYLLLAACNPFLDEGFHPGVSRCGGPFNIELVAGIANSPGTTNSTLTASQFTSPSTILFQNSTQLIVNDEGSSFFRLVDLAANSVTTIAGTGTAGSTGDGGALSAAQIEGTGAMEIRSNGDIILSSDNSHYIRRITSGNIFSFAGLSGTSGTTNGTTAAARFNQPRGIAIDSSDNIFVIDTLNHCIRKIDTGNNVTTFAGLCGTSGDSEGTGTAARFTQPVSGAFDQSGNLFVTSVSNRRIYKITTGGVVTFFAGDGTSGDIDGTGTAARLAAPTGITVDSCGDIYFADGINHKIKRATAAGVVTTVAGTGTSGHTGNGGAALSADLSEPRVIRFNSSTSEYFFSEGTGHTIRKLVLQ